MTYFFKKITRNFNNSLRGLFLGLTEHSFRIELIGGIFLISLLMSIDRSTQFKLIVFALFCLVLIAELINTAIEKVCNRITTDHDEEIRDIKDISSAAVFISVVLLSLGIIVMLTAQPNS